MLARNLWTAMLAGPVKEEETWNVFKKQAHLDDDSLQPMKELYGEQMKPVVTDEQLVALRQRYRLRRQEEQLPGASPTDAPTTERKSRHA
jgi:hypothetical protein